MNVFRIAMIVWAAAAGLRAQTVPQFEKDVLPLLRAKCTSCHGPKVSTAGLDLHEISLVLRGGSNGPVVIAGFPQKSLLWKRVSEGSMPPGKEKLTTDEVELIRQWIEAGALSQAKPAAASVESAYRSKVTQQDREFWSFRPLANPPIPKVKQADLAANAVDAFLLRRLAAKKLTYSKPARKAVLIRRASLDLTGLPPSPAEVDTFVADASPDAYARLIDRLLASPHFGERWGRYWLDLAGYVDTVGRDVQAVGYKVGEGRWRYRDYVVRSYQADKPYDRFLLEQIAGDELFDWRRASSYSPEQLDWLIATGFLRTAEDPTDNPERDTPLLRYEVLHQTVDILTSSVMGVTVGCARCHDHKFDPIPQRDYYRIMAALTPAYNPVKWTPVLERVLPDVPLAEAEAIRKHNAALDSRIKPLREETDRLLEPLRAAVLDAKLRDFPENEREPVRKAALVAEAKRNPKQKQLAAKLGPLDLSAKALAADATAGVRERLEGLAKEIASLEGTRRKYSELECLFENGEKPETFIHRRGDHESPGALVGPGGLEVLSASAEDLPVRPPFSESSGRRLALARWLTSPGTPAAALVARVYVNRIWLHLFGQGLVPTAENFGAMGARPTHPELLEWMAAEFQRNGWRTKPLIRTLMLSRAYRQSSLPADYDRSRSQGDPQAADPENNLLWRMRLRRLESEAIRDSMLAVSGKLNPKTGGPAIKTIALADGMVLIDEKSLRDPADKHRRSLYLVARRRYNLSLMGVFDHPVMSTNATSRGASAVVLQSLMMMNDGEVNAQSRYFAGRLRAELATLRDRIRMAFRYAFGRAPDEEERRWAEGLHAAEKDRLLHAGKPDATADEEALASVCHVLLNANEFLYVE